MTRVSALYGVWMAVCAGLTLLPVTLDDFSPTTLKRLTEIMGTVGVIAGLGWGLFHHQGRQPGGWGYGLLSVLVVLAAHVWIFGSNAFEMSDVGRSLVALAALLILHAWFTLPTAFLATALFVAAHRRFSKAGLSAPSPGRSGS